MALQARNGSGDKGKRWVAIFIGVIMLSSVAGFVISINPSSQGDAFRYGGLTFKQNQQGFYSADLGGRLLEFAYRPESLSDIEVAPGVVETVIGSRAVYLAYGWNNTLAQDMALLQYDAGNILEAKYGIFVQPAFTGANPLNVAVVSCANATPFVPVLLIQEANSTAISADPANPGCIVLNVSDSTALVRVADSFKYAILKGEGK
ncbi:hypothetical protein HYU40_03290 [Candidatus Woesearchaeota archaeon]|nr:hypothetical protein [Candidatus Woesearchaeota archaeon]